MKMPWCTHPYYAVLVSILAGLITQRGNKCFLWSNMAVQEKYYGKYIVMHKWEIHRGAKELGEQSLFTAGDGVVQIWKSCALKFCPTLGSSALCTEILRPPLKACTEILALLHFHALKILPPLFAPPPAINNDHSLTEIITSVNDDNSRRPITWLASWCQLVIYMLRRDVTASHHGGPILPFAIWLPMLIEFIWDRRVSIFSVFHWTCFAPNCTPDK